LATKLKPPDNAPEIAADAGLARRSGDIAAAHRIGLTLLAWTRLPTPESDGNDGFGFALFVLWESQSQVPQLIAGAGGFICNQCVQPCVGIIAAQNPAGLSSIANF